MLLHSTPERHRNPGGLKREWGGDRDVPETDTSEGREGGPACTVPCARLTASSASVSVSINNLYPGCENVSVRSRSMMFEPGLTKGMLEVFVAPSHHPHCSADDQSTKAIDIQNAYLNGTSARRHGKGSKCSPCGARPGGTRHSPRAQRSRQCSDAGSDPGLKPSW